MLGNRLPILHVEMANGMTNRAMRHKEILGRSNGPKNENKLHFRAMLLLNSLEKLAAIRVCFSGEIPHSVFTLQMRFPTVAVVLCCWRELRRSWSFHKEGDFP